MNPHSGLLRGSRISIAAVAFAAIGCGATAYERDAFSRIDDSALARPGPRQDDGPRPELDGSLEGYVAHAMDENPSLRASFEEWRAAVDVIAQRRALPEPELSYGFFLRNVETRVGPQRHRFSLRQMLPWPEKLTASADAASEAAHAAERRFEAAALVLRERIARQYWRIWLHERIHEVLREQEQLLRGLSEAARSRVEIGKASLADLAQIDLSASRIDDALDSHIAKAEQMRARLRAELALPPGTPMPIAGEPPPAAPPAPSDQELLASARQNPEARALDAMAEARRQKARAARSEGLPDFMLGLDYIETGAAPMAGVADSGKDPIILSFGISIPLWRGSYRAAADEAEAESRAFEARSAATRDQLEAALTSHLLELRDAVRRVAYHEDTLIPQARSVYDAVTGAYQTGDSSLASVLIAERDILDLRIELARARSDYARAWAAMERVVGERVSPQEAP